MAGSVVNAASVASATTALSCAMPTGTVQGDVMVAAVSSDWGTYAAVTAPGGWTLRTGQDGGTDNIHCKVFTKTAGASEAGPYAFAQAASSDGVAAIVTLRGVDESTAVGLYGSTLTVTTSSTRTAPTLTGATAGAVLVCGAMTDGSAGATTWTPPSGMTEQVDVQSATFTTESFATLLSPGSPTGTKDFVCTGTPTAAGGIQWSAVFNASGAADAPPWPVRPPGRRSPAGRLSPWWPNVAASQVSAEQGTAPAGTAATGLSVKIAVVAGTCTVGALGTGAGKKVQAHVGAATAAVAGTGVDKHVGVQTGTAVVGAVGTGLETTTITPLPRAALVVSVRRSPAFLPAPAQFSLATPLETLGTAELGVGAVGAATTSVEKKIAVVAGACTVGSSARSGDAKRGAQVGVGAVGFVITRTGGVSRAVTGAALLGGSTRATEVKLGAHGGRSTVGAGGTGAPAKVVPQRGVVTVGLATTRSGVAVRPQAGIAALGAGLRAIDGKIVAPAGVAALGTSERGATAKKAVTVGRIPVGLAGSGNDARRSSVVGRALVGLAGYGETRFLLDFHPRVDPVIVDIAERHRAGTVVELVERNVAGVIVDQAVRYHAV